MIGREHLYLHFRRRYPCNHRMLRITDADFAFDTPCLRGFLKRGRIDRPLICWKEMDMIILGNEILLQTPMTPRFNGFCERNVAEP